MKFVALISGGKDSCYNILHCLKQGHELVALANLYPSTAKDEIDSFMFQTVGHDIIDYYEECIGKPLYRQPILGGSKNQKLEYIQTKDDEIEDLFLLLSKVKAEHPDLEAVSVGAILSSYQRTRVEDVCSRLGLISLAYLWQRDQDELMREMCQSGLDARIIKVAAIGLSEKHLGMSITELYPTLVKLNRLYEVHICGEGGEFETMVLDAPFFKKKMEIVDREVINHSNDDVCYLRLKVQVTEKEDIESEDLVVPPLLNNKFEEIYDNVEEIPLKDEPSFTVEDYDYPISSKSIKLGNKIFISNIHSNESSLESQVKGVFSKLAEQLNSYGTTYQNIQSSLLLVADMTDFVAINSIYCSYFTEPLPPSRICVSTKLATGLRLQLSVVINTQLDKKRGLHVQGRSYWAPCNIGPYSQSIVDDDNIGSLAGQIPLIPSSMALNDTSKLRESTVLSLQHLDNVKNVTGCDKNLSIVAYTTSSSYLSYIQETWAQYEEERPEMLIIVMVTTLPRNAHVEWGGISYKEYRDMYYDSDEEDEISAELKDLQLNKSIIKVNNHYIGTCFYELSHLEELVAFMDDKTHYQVYAKPNDFRRLSDRCPNKAIEFVPVAQVWDHELGLHDFGVVFRGNI